MIPVLLGGGIPLLPPPAGRVTLKLRNQRLYKKTGTLGLEYDILKTEVPIRSTHFCDAVSFE